MLPDSILKVLIAICALVFLVGLLGELLHN
jgi:hypothetical protein